MLPTEVSTKIKPTDAKTIPGIATTHFQDGKKPFNHRIDRNEDPTAEPTLEELIERSSFLLGFIIT